MAGQDSGAVAPSPRMGALFLRHCPGRTTQGDGTAVYWGCGNIVAQIGTIRKVFPAGSQHTGKEAVCRYFGRKEVAQIDDYALGRLERTETPKGVLYV